MCIKEWLDASDTDYLKSIVHSVQSVDTTLMLKDTSVSLYLEEMDVVGDFDIPESKLEELTKEFFSEICLEILIREGKALRSSSPTLIKKPNQMLQVWWDSV